MKVKKYKWELRSREIELEKVKQNNRRKNKQARKARRANKR